MAILAGMTAAQTVLALALLAGGVGLIAAGRRIGERARRRGHPMLAAPVLWMFLGVLLAMNGLLQLLIALV